ATGTFGNGKSFGKMKRHQWAIAVATTYLIVYTFLFETGASLLLLSALFAFSPVVLVWMVYSILRFAPQAMPTSGPRI
ncbi:MAG: hypothetical protein MUF62_10400, partial [Chitinophagaceae bacterium]|nr:hypothetical protein [Chitinophagaceae bacterium]